MLGGKEAAERDSRPCYFCLCNIPSAFCRSVGRRKRRREPGLSMPRDGNHRRPPQYTRQKENLILKKVETGRERYVPWKKSFSLLSRCTCQISKNPFGVVLVFIAADMKSPTAAAAVDLSPHEPSALMAWLPTANYPSSLAC